MSKDCRKIDADLIDEIAERIHIIWMEERLADGWKYGPVRSDIYKTTPCLVPYAQLPDYEKKYDRRIAEIVILTLLEKGYRITYDPDRP